MKPVLFCLSMLMLQACIDTGRPAVDSTTAATPWQAVRATCLPSSSPQPLTCPGDKPSWALYQRTHQVAWLYRLEGRRYITSSDEHAPSVAYEKVTCLNTPAPAQYVAAGVHYGLSFHGLRAHVLPETGQAVAIDSLGPLSGQIIAIYGAVDSLGQLRPISAW